MNTLTIENNQEITDKPYISGFWRRLLALLTDSLIIALFSYIIASLFETHIYKHPILSSLIGYLLVVAYFGLLNSHKFNGQTLGKRLLNIRVVDLNHQPIKLTTSLLRSAIFLAPICLLNITEFIQPIWLKVGIGSILAILYGVTLYLIIFNTNNRRTLHDLLFKTIVIHQDAKQADVPPVWMGHSIFIGFIGLAILGYYSYTYMLHNDVSDENHTAQIMALSPHLLKIDSAMQEISEGENTRIMGIYNARVDDYKLLYNPSFAENLAIKLDHLFPQLINDQNFIMLGVHTSYQFGFASKSELNMYQLTKTDGQVQVIEQMSTIGR